MIWVACCAGYKREQSRSKNFLPSSNLKTQLILARAVILFVFLRGVGVIRVCERAVFFRVKVVLLSSCEL